MVPERIGLLSAIFLALALAVGIATFGVHATNVGDGTVVAGASCLSMPGECGSGGDSNALASVSCSALNCNSATTERAISAIDVLAIGLGGPIAVSAMTGHKDPPDPHPPRSAMLS